jgi:hypothetical protein
MLIDRTKREASIQSGLMDSHTRTYTGAAVAAPPLNSIPEEKKTDDIKPKNKGGRPKKSNTIMPEKDTMPDKVEKSKKGKK